MPVQSERPPPCSYLKDLFSRTGRSNLRELYDMEPLEFAIWNQGHMQDCEFCQAELRAEFPEGFVSAEDALALADFARDAIEELGGEQ